MITSLSPCGSMKFNITAMEVDLDVEVWPYDGNPYTRHVFYTDDGSYFIASIQLHGVELIDVLSEFTIGQVYEKVRKLC